MLTTYLKVKLGFVVIGVGDDDADEDGGQYVCALHCVHPVISEGNSIQVLGLQAVSGPLDSRANTDNENDLRFETSILNPGA